MTTSIEQSDLQRERWRRTRQTLRLLDPETDDFASGGISRLAVEPSVRLVLLPSDPEASVMEFDQEFWSRWLQDRSDPTNGRQTLWGSYHQPASDAALRGWRQPDGKWRSYLALYRHEELDMQLGAAGVAEWGSIRAFPLILIVGRIWAALDLYRETIPRFNIGGPWELTLAFYKTAGSFLGHLAEGWAEPGSIETSLAVCTMTGILLRREISEWPDQAALQSFVFGLAGWIEDSWGSHYRRFLAQRGPLAGRFDTTRYRWA